MGDLEKMQPRPAQRDFFRASRTKWALAPKIRPMTGSLRDCGRAPPVPEEANEALMIAKEEANC